MRDTAYHNQVPAVYLSDDLESSPTKCYGINVEKLPFSLVTGIKIKSEPEASDTNCKSDGDERIHDLDDLGFGNMTLEHLKKTCKKRKRKCSNLVGLNKETMETCSSVKHELPDFRHKDDECDVAEPLIMLKSKPSKKLKSKRKSSRKCVSASSPSAISLIKSNKVHCDEELLQPNEDSLAPVKDEVPEPGFPECQTIFGVTSFSDFSCRKQVESTVTVSNDVVELPYPRKELQYCSLNEVSYEYRENMEPKRDVGVQVPETTIACGLETGSVMYPIEEPLCSVSKGVSCEYLEDVISKFGASSSGWEIVKVYSSKIINYQCSGLQEFGQERYAICALPYDIPSETMPPTKDCAVDLNESFKSNYSEHEMAWKTSSHERTEAPEMDNDDSLQCLENINEGSACSNESSSAHGWPLNSVLGPSSDDGLYSSSSCLNPVRHSVLDSGHSPSAGKQSQFPDSVATDDDASDKSMASPRHPDYHHRKQQQHPERLPSNRKTISPISQERLCQAMELTGSDEEDCQQCRGRLYFGKQTNHRILRAQGLNQFGRDGTTFKPKPFVRKAKQDKKGSPLKGSLRVTHPSGSVPHVRSTFTTIQRCSQSAIAFTQSQMRDIESLATKLTTELKSLKEIVMGILHPELEASAATAAKENVNAVRIAVESAMKAEETAKKWLSMMARDCNRFCKIMKLTEDNPAASERVIHKEKKITFADEAGEKLCHVKVFKDDMGAAASLQRGTEKVEVAG